jgi:hypothetical protein
MAFTVAFNKLIRPPGETEGTTLRWVRIVQDNESPIGEEWFFDGSIFGAVVGYYTRLDSLLDDLLLRPELGNAPGFVFGAPDGSGLARLRREVSQVSATSGATLLFPTGQVRGRSGLSRNLAPQEILTTDIFFKEAAPDAQRGPELYGDWQVGDLSTQALPAFGPAPLPDSNATAILTEPVFVNGAQFVELWVDFVAAGGQVNPSGVRVRFEFLREGTTTWAPLMWEDNANAIIAGNVATLPNHVYEISDTLGDLALPAAYPFTRMYLAPTRTWAGQIRARIYNAGALADGADATGVLIVRGGGAL